MTLCAPPARRAGFFRLVQRANCTRTTRARKISHEGRDSPDCLEWDRT